ncbi:uncharacterized protein [Henckelia pumila]|uniref:uncharacterized protein n=1 Tax=Henckelia pumila TaxID=405737 RepID=UPI003C6E7310
MLIYVCFYPFIIAGSVLGFQKWFLKFILMDSVWFLKQFTLLYECLGLFLLFGFGLKFLCSDWFPWILIKFLRDLTVKSGGLKDGFCPRNVLDGNWVILKFFKDDPKVPLIYNDETEEKRDEKSDISTDSDPEFDAENDVETEDVSELRNLIKLERRRVRAARAELEQERAGSATAAAEAMAMILRLQSEKSSIELESNQYRRLALEKQIHDQRVIQSLRNLVWSHQSERWMLEHRLESNGFSNVDGRDGFDEFEGDLSSCFEEIEDVLENVLYSSRCHDFNLSHEIVVV